MKYSIELIRLIAVILITFTHTRNDFEEGLAHFIFRELPTFGTAILSIVSGYLYYTVSRKRKGLLKRKIKSLAIPFLIANVSVLILVLISNFIFNYNPLNRLPLNFSLISEGLLSLNGAPINPPTYFIRDVFIIFCVIALLTQKEIKALLIIVPFLLFGTLILNSDIAFLFILGILYAKFYERINKYVLFATVFIITLIIGFKFNEFLKFPISFLIFISLLNLNLKFYNTGRFSYLLHLYHSPIIVITYPILNIYIKNPVINVLTQISIAVILILFLFVITKKYSFLRVLSGGR